MKCIDNFFINSNSVCNIPEKEYQKTDLLIRALDAVSRTTYQSVYVIDYFKKNFLYVSGNPLLLCGYTPEEMKRLGYLFYITHVPLKEQDMLLEINRSGFDFFENIPIEERMDYTITYNFHIQTEKKKLLINHKLTPLLLAEDGRVWLATCAVSLSAHHTPGHIKLQKSGTAQYWEYSLEKHRWIEKETVALTEKEKDILYLSTQGYTMNEIADKLCLAVNTVKFYKRKMFERLDVKNIAEALFFVTNHKLL